MNIPFPLCRHFRGYSVIPLAGRPRESIQGAKMDPRIREDDESEVLG